MKVNIIQRSFAQEWVIPKDLKLTVSRRSFHAIGGPYDAEIIAEGSQESLKDLFGALRCGVEIYDDEGVPLWWGYISRVEVSVNKVISFLDLEEIVNEVKVGYTILNQGGGATGPRASTPWYVDMESVEKYGSRQLLETGGSTNLTAASAQAQRILNERKTPRQGIINTGGAGTARLLCYGWWQTLDQVYAPVETKLALSYNIAPTKSVSLVPGNPKIAQSFKTSSAMHVLELGVCVKKVGSPGDLKLEICRNEDDLATTDVNEFQTIPGEVLASVTIAPGMVPTNTLTWVKGQLSEHYDMPAKANYFLVISSTTYDASNYYEVAIDDLARYGDGVCRLYKEPENTWIGTTWDMLFRIYVDELTDTAQQIQNHLVSYGQFFRNIFVDAPSGIRTESFRNGDTTALTEVEGLLDYGTSNFRRLLARVNLDRTVEVWEAPDEPTTSLIEMRDDGELYYRTGAAAGRSFNPVGLWASLDPINDNVSQSGVSTGTNNSFILYAEWDEKEKIHIESASQVNSVGVLDRNG